MSNLCANIGWNSITHYGEQLCGDHLDVRGGEDNSNVIVLADGLGSGVKASILSTLTSKIISTMIAEGLPLEECVDTIAAALPVCSIRGVAYSTFTIIHILDGDTAELIQYDNPHVILIRGGKHTDYEKEEMLIGGKKIYKSVVRLQENDVFIAMSDGCPHAGIGTVYSFGWRCEDIAVFMENLISDCDYTAKALSSLLIDECNRLYNDKPGDDATVCVIKMKKRTPMNLLFGPPAKAEDAGKMMRGFFASEGKHIVCGGTTSTLAAQYLGKELKVSLSYESPDLPPTAEIEGVDLVTEGVITVNKVLEYARDYLSSNQLYDDWNGKKDGASMICRLLLEEATDIRFFVGRAINPAHQNPDLPINYNIKMSLIDELSKCLNSMGKRTDIVYF